MAKKTVTFEFDVDQEVETPFGDIGIVSTLGFDTAGNQYYVQRDKGCQWFKEDQLKAKE